MKIKNKTYCCYIYIIDEKTMMDGQDNNLEAKVTKRFEGKRVEREIRRKR